jgi:hypothetical protein
MAAGAAGGSLCKNFGDKWGCSELLSYELPENQAWRSVAIEAPLGQGDLAAGLVLFMERGEPGRAGGGFRPSFRRPANRVGWLFPVAGQGSGLGGFVKAYGLHALVAAPGSLPAGQRAWGCRLGWSRSAVACRMLMTYGARDDTCSSAGGGRMRSASSRSAGTCEGRDL